MHSRRKSTVRKIIENILGTVSSLVLLNFREKVRQCWKTNLGGSGISFKFYEQWDMLGSVFYLSSVQTQKEERGAGEIGKLVISGPRNRRLEQTCGNEKEESEAREISVVDFKKSLQANDIKQGVKGEKVIKESYVILSLNHEGLLFC